MKNKIAIEDQKKMLEAARIALAVPESSQFWKDVERRMQIRDEARKGRVQPRPARK